MSSLFEVRADPIKRLLHCRLSGRWTLDTCLTDKDRVLSQDAIMWSEQRRRQGAR